MWWPSPVPPTASLDPRCSSLYVGLFGDSTLVEIDTATNTIVSSVQLDLEGISSSGVATSPYGNRVYVTNVNSGAVSIIHTITNSAIATIEVGRVPPGMTVSRNDNGVSVANGEAHNVSVIDTANNTVIATVAAESMR